MFSDYLEYIKPEELTPEVISKLNINQNISRVLLDQASSLSVEKTNFYDKGDELKVIQTNSNAMRTFPLPRPQADGSCDNFGGASFLKDVSGVSCAQRIENLQNAC
jgi:hypothetical protein